MAISRWDPLQELIALQQKMNRLFDTTLSRSHQDEQQELAAGSWVPPIDIYENGEGIVLRVDVPGVRQEDIDVRIEKDTLFLRGERRLDPQWKRENFLRIERAYGTFSRSFTLPPTVDATRIRAEYRNGVLEVSLPRRPETQVQAVKVDVR